MDEIISAAEANRRFSALLRRVRDGTTYVVTSHGKAVAKLSPADSGVAAKSAARDALLHRLARQPAVGAERWTRDELYDDE